MAARLARLLAHSDGDLYKNTFLAAECAGVCWAAAARSVLAPLGIEDWRNTHIDAYDGYMV
jgi:hypothetical protein